MVIDVSGIELTIQNGEEVISMGGPYVGDVYHQDVLIGERCIVNNFIYRDDLNLLFYVQYHQINFYKYFTLNFRNLTNCMIFQFEREFAMVHIGVFINPIELEIYLAFHDKLPETKEIFNIDNEDFYQLDNF